MVSPDPTPPAAPDTGLVLRIGWLALIVTVVHFWSQRHFGVSVVTGVVGSAAITAFLGFLTSLLSHMGQKKPLTDRLAQASRRSLLYAVSLPFLIGVSVGIFIIGSSIASIRIDATGAPSALNVAVSPTGGAAGATQQIGSGGVHHLRRLTTLFGKDYELLTEGFQPYRFNLAPWTGTEVRIPDDLQRQPVLLVRLPPGVLHSIRASRLQLEFIDDGSKRDPITCTLDETQGSVLFGRKASIPADLMPRWSLELSATGLVAAGQSDMILLWSNPKSVEIPGGLVPGQRLRAEFIGANGDVLASRDITLGTEAFQDNVLVLNPNE